MNTTASTFPRSNLIGVTGLSRSVLAAMFRSDGLYGRDSALSANEQAVVQSRLPQIVGLKGPNAPAILGGRLQLLADYVDAVVAGRDSGAEQARLQAAGYSRRAISEAAITVDNVRTVFGAFPIAAVAATTTPSSAPAWARAA